MQSLFENEIIDLDMHCEKERVRRVYGNGQSLVRIWNVLDVVWCGVVWCGVVWCCVVWCGVVWCGVVWCGVCGVYGHSRRSSFGMVLVVSWISKRDLIPKTVSLCDFCSALREIVFKKLAFPSKQHKSLSSALHRRS